MATTPRKSATATKTTTRRAAAKAPARKTTTTATRKPTAAARVAAPKKATNATVVNSDPDKDTKETGRLPYRKERIAVTPAIAKGFLENLHPDQRRHRDGKVEQLAADMRHGDWRDDTEDAVLIDWNGYLIDGQMRMRALIESGKTIEFDVAWGKDPAVMGVKDTGAARTIADSLRISGRGHDMSSAQLNVLGAIARRQLHWESGRRSQGSMKGLSNATHSAIAEIIDRQSDMYGATKIGVDASKASKLIRPAPYGFFWLNANRVDSDMAYRWQSFWMTPEELPGNSPIAVVRERFFRSEMASSRKGFGANRADILKPDEKLALLIKAWTLFLAERKAGAHRLQIARGRLTNENFPTFLTKAEAIKEAEKLDRDAERAAEAKAAKSSTAFSG